MNGFTSFRAVARSTGLLMAVPLFLSACEREPPQEMVEELEALRAQAGELESEVDRLSEAEATLQAVRERLRGLDLPEELATEDDPPLRTQRDTVEALVRLAGRELDQARGRLQAAQGRAATLQRRADSLRAAHDEAEARYQADLARERERVAEMQTEVSELTQRIAALDSELSEATAAYRSLDRDAHQVYYVVGTRDELIRRGVITEEGGARVLFLLWRRGETLVPARAPDPAQFNAVDMREAREIPLPAPEARYRVVSRHDPAYLEPGPAEDGTVTGAAVRITDPEAFWQPSRFLILVQRGS